VSRVCWSKVLGEECERKMEEEQEKWEEDDDDSMLRFITINRF